VEGSEDRRLTAGSASLVFLRLVAVAPFTGFMVGLPMPLNCSYAS
jgi:hypothetical protein